MSGDKHRMECGCQSCVEYWSDPSNPNHCGAAVELKIRLDRSEKMVEMANKKIREFQALLGKI